MIDGGNRDGSGGGGVDDYYYYYGENNVEELVEFFNVLLVRLSGREKCEIISYKHYVQRKP
jgi:hypothetical protein